MHTIGQAIDFIEKVFGESKSSNGGLNISVVCPICNKKNNVDSSKKKLVIRTDKWLCHCWVCGYKSSSIVHLIKLHHPDFLKEFIDNFCNGFFSFENEKDDEELERKKIELPIGFSLLAEQFDNPKNIVASKVKKYLLSRGATERDFWYFKFGTTILDRKFQFRVIIPSFDAEGNLNYYTSRTIINMYKGRKYDDPTSSKEAIIFNEININWNKELTIVEGPFDLLKCNDNATCLLGSSLEKDYELFQKIVKHGTPVLLALDNDAQKKQLKIAKMFAEYDIEVRLYCVPKQFNDVGQMTKKQFIENIPNSKIYSLENDFKHQLGIF